ELRLAAFAALGRRLSAAQTIGEAGGIISEAADQLLGWDACFLDLYSKEDDMLVHVLGSDTIDGKRTACCHRLRRPVSPLVRQAFAENGTLILREPGAEPRPDTAPFGDKSRPSASILVAPIRNGSDLMGVFSIQSYTPAAYNREDLKTLQALADHCGGALDRIRTQESLQATQQQLRQAQKLEAIGQLAGGVAHDFNNLLAVIRGNAELALMQYEGGGREFIDQIIAASDRAANLTRQLLAFSRKQVLQSKSINLNEVIGNLSKMLIRIIGEHIELQCAYAPVAPLVQADVGMIEQVVVNLVVNARDAMPQGGKLRLQIEPVTLDGASGSSCPEARSGRFICLTVTDSGAGIPAEHLPRIFEPFFTTKELGKGTGLGLATAYGIIKQHQGWIEVESQFGQGATFRVLLPALTEGALSPMNQKTNPDLRGGSETILLVEDEEPVRFVTRRLLQQFGYKVHEAVSGVQALELWRDHAVEIDLLLTDLLMPDGISGNALAEKLLADKPALKIVYMSGYGGDVVDKQASFLDRTQGRFLQKPVSGYRLLSSIREFLDQSAPVRPKPRSLLSV
ncbi:MAG TPA: ATP-binding protein, partial [Clostridia bacterium]|nr:ATP-binding protein [Clostridia bacterium]